MLLQEIFLTQGLTVSLMSPALTGRYLITNITWEDPRWRAGPFLGASRKEGEVHEAVYMHKCGGTGGQEGKEAC